MKPLSYAVAITALLTHVAWAQAADPHAGHTMPGHHGQSTG